MTLLQEMHLRRLEERECRRQKARESLRQTLDRLVPGQQVIVFGSLVKPGKFTDESDIDVALEAEPQGMSIYQLIALLSEEMGRPVDVLLLDECRFREKILREGERWIPRG